VSHLLHHHSPSELTIMYIFGILLSLKVEGTPRCACPERPTNGNQWDSCLQHGFLRATVPYTSCFSARSPMSWRSDQRRAEEGLKERLPVQLLLILRWMGLSQTPRKFKEFFAHNTLRPYQRDHPVTTCGDFAELRFFKHCQLTDSLTIGSAVSQRYYKT